MKTNSTLLALAVLTPAMAGCSLFGTTIDFSKVEKQITEKLDAEYGKIGQKVDSVTCDESEKSPKPGSKFMCDAKVGAATVPVEVTVKDEDMNSSFVTTKKLFNLSTLGAQLAPSVSEQTKQKVTVDCGTGLKAEAPGGSFTCPVKAEGGATGTLTLKVGPMTGEDSWEIS
ncbi:hypothetical protein TPB0596_25210 [Tsukamurella pulmonis]|uniref:DUF4333 domain-containing protein n=1 Tax=Tsukamurella pulmonis TaxID=47312 RepID=UPI000791326D|nr:DUF4333 domain-containing protein [Tsukamurella pulmonis]KXP09480.1 hypothetical protein AXK57_11365 [Tsukamurella pulmonis]BDD82758.1 hypothetical protein TPB0596_25210 [Tsukamurella pulmonis]